MASVSLCLSRRDMEFLIPLSKKLEKRLMIFFNFLMKKNWRSKWHQRLDTGFLHQICAVRVFIHAYTCLKSWMLATMSHYYEWGNIKFSINYMWKRKHIVTKSLLTEVLLRFMQFVNTHSCWLLSVLDFATKPLKTNNIWSWFALHFCNFRLHS